jgi:hypothetical protein
MQQENRMMQTLQHWLLLQEGEAQEEVPALEALYVVQEVLATGMAVATPKLELVSAILAFMTTPVVNSIALAGTPLVVRSVLVMVSVLSEFVSVLLVGVQLQVQRRMTVLLKSVRSIVAPTENATQKANVNALPVSWVPIAEIQTVVEWLMENSVMAMAVAPLSLSMPQVSVIATLASQVPCVRRLLFMKP